MSTEQRLLEAIWAAPGDDALRLVYADFLMEQQNPRGEFIRLQCDAAAMPQGHPRNELERRAAEILHRHRAEWSPAGLEWRFLRGFPATVKLQARALLDHLEAIERVPTLEGLELNFDGMTGPLGAAWMRTLSRPIFARCRSLRLTWHVPVSVMLAFVEQPWLRTLESLQVSWVSLPEPVWKALGDCAALRSLSGLDLSLSGANDASVESLARSPWPSLKRLRVANNQLGTRACELIAAPDLFPQLELLDLSWNRVGKKGGALLASSPLMRTLRSLDLSHDQVGDETCLALAQAKPRKLEWLGLTQARVSERGMLALSRALPHTRVVTWAPPKA